MGTTKAFAEIQGQSLIEHVLARVKNLGQHETIIIANRPDDFVFLGLPIYADIIPEKGSLGGIYTAIHYSQSAYTLIVACDLPFLNIELLQYMVSLLDNSWDIVVPRVDGHPQGLHAIYNKTCLPVIHQQLAANQLKVIAFYPIMRVRYLDEPEYARLDPQRLSFYNVNTPTELQQARELIARNIEQ